MSLMRMVCVLALASTLVRPVVAQEATRIDGARLEAAKELIEVTGAKKQIDLMIEVMKQGLGRGVRDAGSPAAAARQESDFEAFAQKFQGYREKMIEDFAALYAEKFSADELKEISAFYRSGTGAKFITSMPELMQRGGRIGQTYGAMAMRDLEAMKKQTAPGKR